MQINIARNSMNKLKQKSKKIQIIQKEAGKEEHVFKK